MRLGGLEIPDKERLEIALTRVYGVGRSLAGEILTKAKIDPNKRTLKLSDDEKAKLLAILETYKIEGRLRQEIRSNINRLKAIGSYRGLRHRLGLPVRGQRTRSNARTRKGKRKTVGALTKEMWAKLEAQQKAKQSKNG